MIMALQKGDFIKISYTGRLEDGKIFDTTDEETAKSNNIYDERGLYGGDVIVIGGGHTITGLDEDFVGKEAGYETELTIPTEKAFGAPKAELMTSVSVSKFKEGKAAVGQIVEQDGRHGVVTKVIGRRATIDFNSPLAGKTVIYKYKIDEVITETAEKVKALFAYYTGVRDAEVVIDGTIAKVTVPLQISFNQNWFLSKMKMARDLTENTELTEVWFVEKFPKITPEEKKE